MLLNLRFTRTTKENKMDRIRKNISVTIQLADQLQEDIRRRNLRPGDSYLTTRGARQFLGVGGTEANQALQLLEKRQIIRRTQRTGSVILTPPKSCSTEIARIHFLFPEFYYRTQGVSYDGFLFGIQSVFPTASVSLHLVSRDGEQIEAMIHNTMTRNGMDAFVLCSVPFEIQKAVAQIGFPAVIWGGTAYHGIKNIPYVEIDNHDAVVKLVRYLEERGAKRIATLMWEYFMPGNQQAFDAILSLLGNSAPIRFLVPDHDHTVVAVRDILCSEPSVDAFLCLTSNQAEAVVDALKSLGRPIDSIEIGVLHSHTKRSDLPKFTHVRCVPTPEEIGQKLASMLRQQHLGNSPKNETIPMELVTISRDRAGR